MSKPMRALLVALCLCLPMSIATAAEEDRAADADRGAGKVRKSLAVLIPDLKIDAVSPSPVPGLYEVVFGSHLIYVTEDGRYLVQGRITDLETREPITRNRQRALRKQVLDRLDEGEMIVYGDADLPYTITVFTDIDCPYCRRMHQQVDEYNRQGIRVRYLAYPRAGPGSDSERKAIAVWCAEDPRQAMTDAKSGKEVPYRECDHPVRRHFRLGQDFGISGTPAIVLENGDIIPGFVPPARLRAAIEQRLGSRASR